MRLYHAEIWECNGKWNVGDVSDLAHMSNAWWNQARAFNLSPIEWFKMVKEKYDIINIHWKREANNGLGYLGFDFTSRGEAEKYMAALNNAARKNRLWIGDRNV